MRLEEVARLKGQQVEEAAFRHLVGHAGAALRAHGRRCRENNDAVGARGECAGADALLQHVVRAPEVHLAGAEDVFLAELLGRGQRLG